MRDERGLQHVTTGISGLFRNLKWEMRMTVVEPECNLLKKKIIYLYINKKTMLIVVQNVIPVNVLNVKFYTLY